MIFLDIDGVLISYSVLGEIYSTAKKLFQNPEYVTPYQQVIASSKHFDPNAIKNLDKIIESIKDSGQRPVVVLSSAWRHALWLDQLARDAYGQYKFSKYLFGKTPIEFCSEQCLAPECQLGFEFYQSAQKAYDIKLDNRGSAIEYWLKDHHFDVHGTNFVVIDDAHQDSLSRFGPRYINTRNTRCLLNKESGEAAINALCNLAEHNLSCV